MQSMVDQIPATFREFVGPIERVDFPDQGATSEVAIVTGQRGRFVVKHVTQPPFHEWLRREHDVLQSLASSRVRVPRSLKYFEAETPVGHSHWLLMDYIPGIPLRVHLRHESNAAARHTLLFQFGQMLASIHNENVPDELRSEEPWLDGMLHLATRYLRDYDVDGDSDLLHKLSTERPDPTSPCLIHGDYTLDNVLVSDGRVSAVIDWCWGALGDPRHDLAIAARPKSEAFHDPADLDAFYDGYGGQRLTEEEQAYFLGLYEFF